MPRNLLVAAIGSAASGWIFAACFAILYLSAHAKLTGCFGREAQDLRMVTSLTNSLNSLGDAVRKSQAPTH